MGIMQDGSIVLAETELRMYTRLGSQTAPEDMAPEDAVIVGQIGLFFATNPHLANLAIDIAELTLIPPVDDKGLPISGPPIAVVAINKGTKQVRIYSNAEGYMPAITSPNNRRGKRL